MAGINRKCGICIRGVSDACSNELLEATFKRFGTITDTFVKAQRGYAFVTFADEKSVAMAIEGAPSSIGQDQVTVEARTEDQRRNAPPTINIYINGLPEDTTENMVAAAVAGFGQTTSMQVQADRGFAFVGFTSVEEATKAVNASPLSVNGAQAAVEFRRSKPRGERKNKDGSERKGERKRNPRKPRARRRKKIVPNSIWIKGVPEECEDDDIFAALSGFGTVLSVSHDSGRDFAFAAFDSPDGMNGAVAASGNVNVGGNKVVIQERTGKKPAGAEDKKPSPQ